MGRPQKIFVSRQKLLRNLAAQISAEVQRIDQELIQVDPDDKRQRRHLEYARCLATEPELDLEELAGRRLSPSERIRHQEAIRRLDAEGLIERNGRRVRLTAAGWTKAGIEQPSTEDED